MAVDSDELEEFRDTYEEYRQRVLEPLSKRVNDVFTEWREPSYWRAYSRFEESAIPAPLQRTKVRIKRIESVLDKFRRMPDEFPGAPGEENLRRMRDAIGARIVVFFPGQLDMVDREVRSGKHFELSPEIEPKSYLPRHMMESCGLDPARFRGASKKPSGYASIHYAVRLVNGPGSGNPWFEIQTRTMLEEVWGEVEHQIGYKPDSETSFSVKRQFRVISEHLGALDAHFDFLNNEVAFLQANTDIEDDDTLNAENLPRVLRGLECVILQREINGLIRVLQDHGVTTVGALKHIARLDLVEAIQTEYRALKDGRTPTAFDVVPVLLSLDVKAAADDARRVLRLHVDIADRARDRAKNR